MAESKKCHLRKTIHQATKQRLIIAKKLNDRAASAVSVCSGEMWNDAPDKNKQRTNPMLTIKIKCFSSLRSMICPLSVKEESCWRLFNHQQEVVLFAFLGQYVFAI